MGLTINRGVKQAGVLVSDRRLCLTADKGRVVEADDPGAAFLFATPGYEIPAADVERFGLLVADGVIVVGGSVAPTPTPEPEPEPEPEPAGTTVDLPEDMPGREALVAAGLVTLSALGEIDDLTKVPGIGKATAAKLREYLEELAD